MNMSTSKRNLQAKNFLRPFVVALLVLIIPLIATNTVEGFNWGPGDFVGMGVFLYVFGVIFEVAMAKLPKYRLVAGIIIVAIFFTLYGLMATTD